MPGRLGLDRRVIRRAHGAACLNDLTGSNTVASARR
jgi:hypothetical protein